MKITWYGHSCFKMESPAGSVIFDPYERGSVPGCELPVGLSADIVLCSHGHGDHNAASLVSVSGAQTDYTVETMFCWHDDAQGAKRGDNLIRIVSGGGFRVAHLGDIGHMLPDSQIRILHGVDALMIPVGGYYTIDAATARALVERIEPAVTFPMHYRGEWFGFDEIAALDSYTSLCSDVEYVDGDSYELTSGEGPKTVVFNSFR